MSELIFEVKVKGKILVLTEHPIVADRAARQHEAYAIIVRKDNEEFAAYDRHSWEHRLARLANCTFDYECRDILRDRAAS